MLHKPFSRSDLAAKVREIAERRQDGSRRAS
jgi:DNA-binding response OmpR family regulator